MWIFKQISIFCCCFYAGFQQLCYHIGIAAGIEMADVLSFAD